MATKGSATTQASASRLIIRLLDVYGGIDYFFRSLPDRPKGWNYSIKSLFYAIQTTDFTTEGTEVTERNRGSWRFDFDGLALFLAASFDHFAVAGAGLLSVWLTAGLPPIGAGSGLVWRMPEPSTMA